jgi:hypothetical protein
MSRLPLVAAVLSALLAGLLWWLATSLESEQRWLDAARPDVSAGNSAQHEPARDTALRVEKPGCEQAEEDIRQSVGAARACRTDDDCIVFDYGYPIECLTSVARAEISGLRQAFERYHRSCEYRVYYDCPTGEAERRAVCRNRQCTINLVTLDALKDDTLDHLGFEH